MDIETFRNYCLNKKGTTEETPFGPDTLVFKVMGKMFALTGLESKPFKVSLKCDPERAMALREEFDGKIEGAYHMNKKHWNAILPEALPPNLVKDLIDRSYNLVVKGLTKKQKEELEKIRD
ncbi:MAG TPA: MmcQ/YjbR family DNA-binding protein [Salinimicrobium sp.]|nr:MmcQ/YjbR family DNA-binding protein [Salinimicrobium sp.]